MPEHHGRTYTERREAAAKPMAATGRRAIALLAVLLAAAAILLADFATDSPKQDQTDAPVDAGATTDERPAVAPPPIPPPIPPYVEIKPVVLPRWKREDREAKPVFLGAVGGAYRGGPESFFVNLGIPHHRLREDELADYDVLKQYGVVWIAGPYTSVDQVWKAVQKYVANGGVAILEMMWQGVGSKGHTYEKKLLGGVRNRAFIREHLTIRGGSSSLFKGLKSDAPVHAHIACASIGTKFDKATTAHGALYRRGRKAGPVLIQRKHGKGTVYLLSVPLGFTTMWRDDSLDVVGRNILLDAVAGRYAPLHARLTKAETRGSPLFEDDFTRTPEEGVQWEFERGRFQLTGPDPLDESMAFAFRSIDDSIAVAGNRSWSQYCVSAAVLTGAGCGGVWVTTSRDRRMLLLYEGMTGRLRLVERNGHEDSTVGAVSVAAPHEGWRRMSLFRRDGKWQGWFDGHCAVSKDAGDEYVAGQCGIISTLGEIHVDDAKVRPTSTLVSGRDVCVGEQASPRSAAPQKLGLEPRTIYAPQWLLRPDPHGRHGVSVPLPVYGESRFVFDGKPLGMLAPCPHDSFICYPEGRFPSGEVALVCPQWRDYTFGGRLTDWYGTGSEWRQAPRWSCSTKWSWLGVDTRKYSILWCREDLRPPYCFYVLVAPSVNPKTKRDEGRNLNLVLSGDGKYLSTGYLVKTQPLGDPGIELHYRRQRVDVNPDIGLPRGHALHHRWFEIKAVVDTNRIRVYYEGRLAIDHKTAERVPFGRVGFWTINNSVRIARAIVAVSDGNDGASSE